MPKLELYDESVFLVLKKTARYLDDVEEVEFGEIQVFIGDGFLVHVRHGEASPLRLVRKDAEHHPELLRCGPSAVLHAITDHVVDSYEPVIAGLGERRPRSRDGGVLGGRSQPRRAHLLPQA